MWWLVMVSVDSVAKQSKQLIYELTASELKQLLMDLVKKYYLAYINNDADGMESIKNKINEVLVVYDDATEIKQYFNYCIGVNTNIIIKSILKKDGELLEPFRTGCDAEFKSLHERMQKNIEYFIILAFYF